MAFEIGQRVAVIPKWQYARIDTIARLTPNQGVLSDGTRFNLKTGNIVGGRGRVTALTDDIEAAIASFQEQKRVEEKTSTARSRLYGLISKIQRSYYKSLTAEQCDRISEEIESCLR